MAAQSGNHAALWGGFLGKRLGRVGRAAGSESRPTLGACGDSQEGCGGFAGLFGAGFGVEGGGEDLDGLGGGAGREVEGALAVEVEDFGDGAVGNFGSAPGRVLLDCYVRVAGGLGEVGGVVEVGCEELGKGLGGAVEEVGGEDACCVGVGGDGGPEFWCGGGSCGRGLS